MIKLWVLAMNFIMISPVYSQTPYGYNSEAGKYVNSEGARIYYEVYGAGEPLVMMHGALYGYIDEFSKHIPVLKERFKVIAIGVRGHGKSELGNQDFSYELLAGDVKQVMDQEGIKSAYVVGFSTGGKPGKVLQCQIPRL